MQATADPKKYRPSVTAHLRGSPKQSFKLYVAIRITYITGLAGSSMPRTKRTGKFWRHSVFPKPRHQGVNKAAAMWQHKSFHLSSPTVYTAGLYPFLTHDPALYCSVSIVVGS